MPRVTNLPAGTFTVCVPVSTFPLIRKMVEPAAPATFTPLSPLTNT